MAEEILLLPVLETAASMKWEVYIQNKTNRQLDGSRLSAGRMKKGVGAFGTEGNPNRETPWNTLTSGCVAF